MYHTLIIEKKIKMAHVICIIIIIMQIYEIKNRFMFIFHHLAVKIVTTSEEAHK